jgi:peroxiredoxin
VNPFGAGDPAPDASLLDRRGRSEQLSTTWSDRPAVLVFLRYFGCPLCQQQVATLRADEGRFAEADTNVVLVGQGRPSDAERFVEEKSLPFGLLVDPTRAAFHTYGLIRGSFSQVFGPRVLVPMLRAAAQPESRQRLLNGGHLMQMPGTFVVDTAGIVHLAHRNVTIADNPTTAELLQVLQRVKDLP